MKRIRIKRIYDAPAADGLRILVDRLWPRGVSRESAQLDEWLKPVAPSDDLRRWFGHDAAKWPEFRKRYLAELDQNPAFSELQELIRPAAAVTLLYAAKDPERNNAAVLRDALIDAMKR